MSSPRMFVDQSQTLTVKWAAAIIHTTDPLTNHSGHCFMWETWNIRVYDIRELFSIKWSLLLQFLSLCCSFCLSGSGSGVHLPGCCPGTGRWCGLSRVSLQRVWKRTYQEAACQPRRLHTDRLTACILQGNTQCLHCRLELDRWRIIEEVNTYGT